MEYKNSITTKGIIELCKLKPTQLKVFLALLKFSSNNLIDMKFKDTVISDFTSYSKDNIRKRINELCNIGLLIRCCNSAYFIDPIYALNGLEDDIYIKAECIENCLNNK